MTTSEITSTGMTTTQTTVRTSTSRSTQQSTTTVITTQTVTPCAGMTNDTEPIAVGTIEEKNCSDSEMNTDTEEELILSDDSEVRIGVLKKISRPINSKYCTEGVSVFLRGNLALVEKMKK